MERDPADAKLAERDRLRIESGAEPFVGERAMMTIVAKYSVNERAVARARGLIDARQGHISLGGEDITRMRSAERMKRGMTYMSELAVFPDLSIEENIRVGAQALGHANPSARVDELYGLFPVLRDKRRDPASSLSGGQRKMLGIAKALSAEPKLLVMDEPSAGLSPLFVKEVIRVLSSLQGRGLALLIAEQNIAFLQVATRVFVLEGGRIRFSGTVAEMSGNEELHRAYFGLK